MKRLNEKTKRNLIVLSLVIIIALLGYGITNSLKTQQTSDELISDKDANTVVYVQAIEEKEEAKVNDEIIETEVPEIITTIDNQNTANISEDADNKEESDSKDAKLEPPSEKPNFEPPKEKPETVPPEELLKENSEYVSAADTTEVDDTVKKTDEENIDNQENVSEPEEKSNLVPADENPFINAGDNTVINETDIEDISDHVPGTGDKF
jgi:FtsZ-interacting cell division protein ZipA